MQQFIPMTDEMLYRNEGLPGPLVPYRYGVACSHGLRIEPADPAMFPCAFALDQPHCEGHLAVSA